MKKNTDKEAIVLAKYYHSWINECVHLNSRHTVNSYQYTMNLYIKFLENEKDMSSKSFIIEEHLSAKIIKEWIIWMKKERKSTPETCNVRLASIRSFLKYLGEEDIKYRYLYIDAKNIHRLKAMKKKVCGLTKDAVKVLFTIPDVNTDTGYRDIVLMAFLYGTAARIDEVLSIKVKDLYFRGENSYVTIIGKGNKVRTLYLPPKLVSSLAKYIKKFHHNDFASSNILFYSRVKGVHTKITQEAINKRLKIYAKQAHEKNDDVPISLHCHQFRHAKASHLLDDGMNIVQLSKLLGHVNIETTMVYLNITTNMQEKALINLEEERVRNLPKKWNENSNKLSDLFKVKE